MVAGEPITRAAREAGVNIYPVDSEHSAIFQCLVGEWHNPIEKDRAHGQWRTLPRQDPESWPQ